jgi:hypothetical protein
VQNCRRRDGQRDAAARPRRLQGIVVQWLCPEGARMEEGPDLSHLTPEERAIIESVMVRQKQEEEREQEIMR